MTIAKISWLSNASSFFQACEEGKISGKVTGGVAYNFDAFKALSRAFEIHADTRFVRRDHETMLAYGRRIADMPSAADMLIKDPMVFAFHKQSRGLPTIGMVHHIDYLRKRNSIRHWAYLRRLERMMTKLNRVVVVSEFWRDYVIRHGVKDAIVIHNSFDLKEFEVPSSEVDAFSDKYDIPNDRPVVYLGMASTIKGFERAYDVLGGEDLTLIATGTWNGPSKSGLKVLQLDRAEFLAMLHRSDLTVSLPNIPEGWSRVAHESLLCGTPVIGLKSGGMTELLSKAGQHIITSDKELIPSVRRALAQKSELARQGIEFVRRFDMDYFRKAWIEACDSLR